MMVENKITKKVLTHIGTQQHYHNADLMGEHMLR